MLPPIVRRMFRALVRRLARILLCIRFAGRFVGAPRRGLMGESLAQDIGRRTHRRRSTIRGRSRGARGEDRRAQRAAVHILNLAHGSGSRREVVAYMPIITFLVMPVGA